MVPQQKAIFLDRDGVLNYDPGTYTIKYDDITILPGVIEFLKWATRENFLLIIITNQACVAKGLCTESDIESLMEQLIARFRQENIKISDYYYSPHHQDFGNSLLRKPGSLMIEKALAKYGITKKLAYFIGDMPSDMLAAEAAGIRGIPVEKNAGLAQFIGTL
jgi:D-glycero-D-manno-heptose 1,7-bisphosphate phosphatase